MPLKKSNFFCVDIEYLLDFRGEFNLGRSELKDRCYPVLLSMPLKKSSLFCGDVEQLLDHRGEFDHDRSEYNAYHRHQLNENVKRGAGGVLARTR